MNTFRIVLFLIIILGLIISAQTLQRNAVQDKAENTAESGKREAEQALENGSISPSPAEKGNDENTQDAFMYPNATRSGPQKYVSHDDPVVITEWYKNKIANSNMTTKTFIQTRANDSVQNKLVGSGKNGNVSIEISKKADENTVVITISES